MSVVSRQATPEDVAEVGATFAEGNTGADNASALAALALSKIRGGTSKIVIEPGTYRLAWAVDVAALYTAGVRKLIIIPRIPGSVTFTNAPDSSAITWDNSGRASSPIAITAISLQNHNTYDYLHRLSIASSGWSKNDRINIQSQDRPEYSSTRWVGEAFRARTVDSSYVYVDGRLEYADRYATSMVARKLDDQIKIRIHGIHFAADGDSSDLGISNRTAAMVTMTAAVDCLIRDCTFDAPWYLAVRMNSCVDCFVDRATYWNGLNNPAVDQLTYGLNCYGACHNCWMINSKSSGFRHTFTTDGNSNASTYSTANWATYGQPTHCGAKNCDAVNAKGAPWDTHEEGSMISFINCRADMSHSADEAGVFVGGAFQIRCRRVLIDGCSGVMGNTGISWKPYEHGTENWVRVRNSVLTFGTYSSDQSRGIYITTGGTLTNRPKIYLENVTVDQFGNSIESDLAVDVEVDGFRSIRPHRTHIDLADGCILRGKDVLWDSRSANLVGATTQNRTLAGFFMAGVAEAHIDGLVHILGTDSAKHTPSVFQSNDAAKTISAVTKANPAVVTSTAHGYTTGTQILIHSASGMTQLNGRVFTITVTDANTYSLDGVDSTSYGTYSGTTGRSQLVIKKKISLTGYQEQDPSGIGRRPIIHPGQSDLFTWIKADSTVNGSTRLALNSGPAASAANAATLLAALQGTARHIVVPAGTYYVDAVDATLTGDKMLTMEPGANLIQTQDAPVLTVSATPQWTQAVSAITPTDVDLIDNAADGTAVNRVPVLTLTGARTLRKGDIVKIISDDIISGAYDDGDPNKKLRRGEYAVVALDSTGTSVTLTQPLRDLDGYSTNVRLVLLTDYQFEMKGGEFDYVDSLYAAGANSSFVVLKNLVRPVVRDFSTARALEVGLMLLGCYGALVTDPSFANHLNEGTTERYGYGIDARSCGGVRVVNPRGTKLRHVATDNNYGVTTSDADVARYGKCWDLSVSGGLANGGSNAPWDTHWQSDGAEFVNCHALGIHAGRSSGGIGFGLRGRNAKIIGGKADGCRAGITLSTYSGGRVIGSEVRRSYLQALRIQNDAASPITGVKAVIRDSFFETIGSGAVMIADPSSGTVEIDISNCVFKLTGNVATSKVFSLKSAIVRGRNVTVDLTEYTGSAVSLFYSEDGNNDVRIDGLVILGGSATMSALVNAGSSGNTSKYRLRNVEFDGVNEINTSSTNRLNLANHAAAAAKASGRKTINGATPESTAYLTQTAAAAVVPGGDHSLDPHISLILGGSNGAVAMGNLPALETGQIISIRNESNGTVTISSPSISLAVNATQTWAKSATGWRQIG
jgi:hypothetical protein